MCFKWGKHRTFNHMYIYIYSMNCGKLLQQDYFKRNQTEDVSAMGVQVMIRMAWRPSFSKRFSWSRQILAARFLSFVP